MCFVAPFETPPVNRLVLPHVYFACMHLPRVGGVQYLPLSGSSVRTTLSSCSCWFAEKKPEWVLPQTRSRVTPSSWWLAAPETPCLPDGRQRLRTEMAHFCTVIDNLCGRRQFRTACCVCVCVSPSNLECTGQSRDLCGFVFLLRTLILKRGSLAHRRFVSLPSEQEPSQGGI